MKLAVVQTVGLAYRDAYRAVVAMPALAAIAAAVSVGHVFIPSLLFPDLMDDPKTWTKEIGSFAASVVYYFLMTPFLIATHRYILLHEITPLYTIQLQNTRFRRFFAYTVFLLVITSLPTVCKLVIDKPSLLLGLSLTLIFASCYATLLTMLIFPAIAIDAVDAELNNATTDARGNLWRLFLVIILSVLAPLGFILLSVLIDNPATGNWARTEISGTRVIATLFLGFASFLIAVVLVAAASHAYRALAVALQNRPSGVAA